MFCAWLTLSLVRGKPGVRTEAKKKKGAILLYGWHSNMTLLSVLEQYKAQVTARTIFTSQCLGMSKNLDSSVSDSNFASCLSAPILSMFAQGHI